MPAPLESQLHTACYSWIMAKSHLDVRYRWFHHSPNGEYRSKRTGAKLKRMGVSPGFPDFVCPIASGAFNGLAIELKREGGKLTQHQHQWLAQLATQGWQVAVCYTLTAFIAGVERYFNLPN